MKYTKEQHDFICTISPGKYNQEIAELFNARFGTKVTAGQIKSYKGNHKIASNVPKKRYSEVPGLFTTEQKDFIKQNVNGLSNQKLADLVNKKFNLSVTAKQVRTWKKNNRISSGLTGQFEKGSVPANKGTKGLYNVGGNKTSFKTGQRPNNYKPIGTEKIDKYGYVLVKVQDDGPWHKRWRGKHKVIWEKENGPVPPGHKLLFADQNKQNLSLDNLILVTNKQMVTLNTKGLLTNKPDLNKTGLIVADLYHKISERKKVN